MSMLKRLALVCFAGVLSTSGGERGIWLCVGPESLVNETAPLCELRSAQGWKVERSSMPLAEGIAALPTKPAAILILADDDSPGIEAARLPYHGWLAKHPKEFASDSMFGDLDHDGVPDVPVGRIPAHNPEELAAVIRKILAWEARTPSPEDLSIPVWAGDPGFGRIGDVMAQVSLPFFMQRLRHEAPPWAGFWLMHSEPRSPFCGWVRDSAATFNQRIGQGGLLSAMIGHGRNDSWWITTLPSGPLRYRAEDARSMMGATPAPPHLVFACRCGAFADPEKACLGEEMLFAPGGPVACIAASVDSHPITNYYGSTSLLACLRDEPADTLGQLWVESIRHAHSRRELTKELLVSALEPFVIGTRNPVRDLKADHLLIYNLLGDPATQLFLPRPLRAQVLKVEEGWRWTVEKPEGLPAGAKLLVQQRVPLPNFRLGQPSPEAAGAMQVFREANATLDFRTLRELDSSQE
ncbi:C25 family cysteine peptidase [Luteolibacter sp. GHJ8]|uniref:C25 family cysteine peptidase n=1 Tax=Luteolibacter rhizosphaerae TaxID=2989719 RepID=A0ABT3G092_9BACT|nr:C25 family cysteine peptidase [Luteolibacter rhizosphaerae]MCW1913255.1 C25 family cysteine peptidase [Luteolibacter rhizosphaerae]